jgi:uncharacterized FAD-dependent dehydrogenase
LWIAGRGFGCLGEPAAGLKRREKKLKLILHDLRIPIEEDGTAAYIKAAAEQLNVLETAVHINKILNKAFDISDKEQFFVDLSVVVAVSDSFDNKDGHPLYVEEITPPRKSKNTTERPVIIGFGPAGMFAALELIEHGLKPIIFERGEKIEERTREVQKFKKQRVLNPESNIQFGEGGAGSFSDGKIFSRKRNTKYVSKMLDTFVRFGAPEKIGYVAKPHLGTDVLCVIVRNMRNYILEQGGEIHFHSKMTDLLLSEKGVVGVVINGDQEYQCSSLYLAVGHSADDTFEMLQKKGVYLEQKHVSVGLRVEHPVHVINRLRYGKKYENFPGIGTATYSLNHTDRIKKRGVHTFCMCPGGEMLNASSENGMLVVNGMSYSRQSSKFSNAGLIVTCKTEDYPSIDPLAGVEFQKKIERKAFKAGGGDWKVPAQNLLDYMSGKFSGELNENSCATGVQSADLTELFPDFVNDALRATFSLWEKEYPSFITAQAILFGAETRTAAPLRILRGKNFESVNTPKLYPIGEGAGYAGGITSSATDGIKAVQAILSVP